MKHTPLTALAILSLALVGCGSTETTSDEPQNAEEAQQQYADELESQGIDPMHVDDEDAIYEDPDTPTSYPTNADYYFTSDGQAVGKFSLPTKPNEEISNTFNTLLPEEYATFIKVTIDNREGESQYPVDTITGYDTDGKEYTFQDFSGSMLEPLWDMWENIDIWDDNAMETYEHLESIVFGMDNTVEPGAVKDVWLISKETDLPQEFTRLGVNGGSSYMGGSDPLPAEMAEVDLDFEAPAN